jgi:hypothetical protein
MFKLSPFWQSSASSWRGFTELNSVAFRIVYGLLREVLNCLKGQSSIYHEACSSLYPLQRLTLSSVFGDKGALRGGLHPGRLQIIRWLNDTPYYRDGLEIVAEKARHFWWGQQVNLGLISWSMYLAVEGRRRKISHLWAFLALAQLVNLSYAQNLFFVAVLLTPVPLPENVREITRSSLPITSSRSGLPVPDHVEFANPCFKAPPVS